MNENVEDPVEAGGLDAPNVMGEVVAGDAPNENTEEFWGCQEEPKTLVVGPLVELPDLPSEAAAAAVVIPKLRAVDPKTELVGVDPDVNWNEVVFA